MGFVRTAEEIAAIERVVSEPHFVSGERLTVEFLTDQETYERLLPPPLEPAEAPLVIAGVGRWRSNCVGDYAGGSISLAARHEGVTGSFAVAMWMDSEPAIVFGRDVFGEPKKLASSNLFRDDDRVHAWIDRHGVRLVAIAGDLGDELGPSETERVAFNYRSRPTAGGIGLDGPAVLTAARFTTTIRSRREGSGSVELTGTVHDPLDELRVASVLRAEYQEHDLVARCEAVATVPAEDFLPYHYGRIDDVLALNSAAAGAGHRATAVR
jgi:acetoacetate decarboxylase